MDAQIGIDLAAISKVRRVFDGKAALLAEVFTPEELRYSLGRRHPFEHLAARYAAKEAVFKGLQTGLSGRLRWHDVEIVREARGEPRLILRGHAARLAAARGYRRCAVTLTHAGDYALAAVLLTA
jgi:holo-[acyl-carrier protein] synthase